MELKSRAQLPRAVLLNLDDTILDDSLTVDDCWLVACERCCAGRDGIDARSILTAIFSVREWYWSDADRHRVGRLDLLAARREVVRLALAELRIDDLRLANAIGDAYAAERDARMAPLPGAIETLQWLRESGQRLALLTNGSGPAQRTKIERFGLAGYFDAIFIEGEVGFGKPDPRVFEQALAALDVMPADAWMVGDNLEWDVVQPQRMGLFAVWVDGRGRGLPEGSRVRPDRVVRSIAELRHVLRVSGGACVGQE